MVTVKGSDERIKTTLSYTYKDFAYNNLVCSAEAEWCTVQVELLFRLSGISTVSEVEVTFLLQRFEKADKSSS